MGDDADIRVLVVEDDGPSLDATQQMLGVSGFEVSGANNGAVGLEQVLTFRPDVVVFDFWMPVVDGRELLQGIREVGRSRLGLVAMSGTPEVEDWCGRVGVTQFLRKPFDRPSLVEAVRRALDDARADSLRARVSTPVSVEPRVRPEGAVMIVGSREAVRPIRTALRDGERPVQVAVVDGIDDAVRALNSFMLDAVAVCNATDDEMLPALLVEATARGLPVILDRAPRHEFGTAQWAQLHVAESADSATVIQLIRTIVAKQRS